MNITRQNVIDIAWWIADSSKNNKRDKRIIDFSKKLKQKVNIKNVYRGLEIDDNNILRKILLNKTVKLKPIKLLTSWTTDEKVGVAFALNEVYTKSDKGHGIVVHKNISSKDIVLHMSDSLIKDIRNSKAYMTYLKKDVDEYWTTFDAATSASIRIQQEVILHDKPINLNFNSIKYILIDTENMGKLRDLIGKYKNLEERKRKKKFRNQKLVFKVKNNNIIFKGKLNHKGKIIT